MILFRGSRAAILCCAVLGWTVRDSGLLADPGE